MSAPAPREGVVSKQRLEALSDGVFAVVITLLVLELRPEFVRAADEHNHAIGEALQALKHPLRIYAATFLLGGMFWIFQNRKFVLLTHTTVRNTWLSLLFLFWVTLLPPTFSIVGNYTGFMLYLANMALIALTLLAGLLDARWSGLIAPADRHPHTALALRVGGLTAGCLVAIAVTPFIPDYAIFVLLAVALTVRFAADSLAHRFSPAP